MAETKTAAYICKGCELGNRLDTDALVVRTDGGGRTRIGSESGVYLHVHGEWLFYFNPSASKKGFYRAALDGSSPVMISGMPAGEYWIIREYIYYRNMSDNGKPYQLMLDGSIDRPLR
ncbi:MAG: DUF5050 domain-containing protein [Clostridia bacterium]